MVARDAVLAYRSEGAPEGEALLVLGGLTPGLSGFRGEENFGCEFGRLGDPPLSTRGVWSETMRFGDGGGCWLD